MSELRKKVESLHKKTEGLKDAAAALKGLETLGRAVESKSQIFGLEPWHKLDGDSKPGPAEYLLRLKDEAGETLPPYPFIMTFYNNGLTVEIDTILFLSALGQFAQDSEKQITVNVSARSLANGEFIKAGLAGLEQLKIKPGSEERVILEIHESTGAVKMSAPVLEAFRKIGAGFAIDDVGLSLDNVFRLSEFDGIADYLKIDRKSVCAHPGEPHALSQVMSFARSLLPHATVVAEGVQSAEHAMQIFESFPDIKYAQGLYLPPRAQFAKEYAAAKKAGKRAVK